jgi:hypothetical protein
VIGFLRVDRTQVRINIFNHVAGVDYDPRVPAVTCSTLRSGRACLASWNGRIEIDAVYRLFDEVRRGRDEAGARLLLICVIPESTGLPPPSIRSALVGALPALMSCCEAIFVVLHGGDRRRELFRALLGCPRITTYLGAAVQVFENQEAALAAARSMAPNDVLALQYLALHQRRT